MESTPHPQDESLDRIVPLCDLCRRVRDSGHDDYPSQAWVPLQTFFRERTIHQARIVFARTYCDDCRRSYDLAVQYGEFR